MGAAASISFPQPYVFSMQAVKWEIFEKVRLATRILIEILEKEIKNSVVI